MHHGIENQLTTHKHNLTYVLKTDDSGHYTGRVIEIPAVIVQGNSKDEIKQKINRVTKDYLQTFDDEHTRITAKKDPVPKMVESGYGHIIETKQIQVQC